MEEHNNPQERRNYSRIPFTGTVHIRDHDQDWIAPLLDVSLKGLLVTRPDAWTPVRGQAYPLQLSLAEGALTLRLEGAVAHLEKDYVGFRWTQIDLDSITHLRRLVELNLGDNALLQRELEALVASLD